MKVLLITPDPEIRRWFTQGLPRAWGLECMATAEDAMGSMDVVRPDLLVADQVLSGMGGIAFFQLLHSRMAPPPAMVLITPGSMNETAHAAALGLKVQEILHRPVDEEAVQRIYAPYRLVDGPLNMSLLEFLVTGYTDMSNRQLDLVASGHKLSLVFGVGYLWAICHPLFCARYRSALVGAGFALEPQGEDDLLDQAAVEERLGPSPQLSALKIHTVLSILASIPLHLNFQARIAEVIIPEGLIPMDIPSVVVPLVEHVPESALAVLRTPGLKVRRVQDVIPADLPILPHQGYILSVCEKPTMVQDLIQMGAVPESQILSSLYLLLLLGLLCTEPAVAPPFRLSGLEAAMEDEIQRVRRQTAALEGLVRNFQQPGRSPYDILGIPSTADAMQAMEAYNLMQDRLSPQKIHPEVFRRHQKDIMLLKAKLSEAFLLLQSSYFEDKKEAQESRGTVAGPGSMTRAQAGAGDQKALQKKEAEKMVAMARDLLAEDKHFDAGQCLKLAILYDPLLADAHHLMGRVYVRLKDARAKHMAERKFLDALQLDPRNIEIHLDLTELYLSQGLVVRSRACFNRAQRMDPRHPRVLALRETVKQAEKK